MTVAITDVVLRDAHQSLFATRLRLDDMLPVAAQLDDVGYRSLECWGGATTPMTWWSASWSAPSKTAWTSSASSMP